MTLVNDMSKAVGKKPKATPMTTKQLKEYVFRKKAIDSYWKGLLAAQMATDKSTLILNIKA